MTPENAADNRHQRSDLAPENTAMLTDYAAHLERSPLIGAQPRGPTSARSALI
jgi:hypothetical protein